MTTPGVKTQRSVVDVVAQRGYDHLFKLEKRRDQVNAKPIRHCSLDECNVVLSRYNDTDFCALHEPRTVPVSKLI